MRDTAAEVRVDRVARDGGAAALATRLALVLILLTGCVIGSLLLTNVRQVLTAAVSEALPAMQPETGAHGK